MEVEHQGSTDATLRQNCEDLVTLYHNDFDGTEFPCAECSLVHFISNKNVNFAFDVHNYLQ